MKLRRIRFVFEDLMSHAEDWLMDRGLYNLWKLLGLSLSILAIVISVISVAIQVR